MKFFRVLAFSVAVLSIGILSCKKSSALNCGSTGFALSIQDEANNLSSATTAYSADPTTANCQAYRQAYIDYIDALKGWEKCVNNADRAEWLQSIEQAEQEAENIQC